MLHTRLCSLRPWQLGDEISLVRHANDRAVWRNMTDLFPHPYTLEDAEGWIRRSLESNEPEAHMAIVVDGEAVGGVGATRKTDLARLTAEFGYWLGQHHWGRGIATEAARSMLDYTFATFDYERLEAGVLEWNRASCRVLEKVGFELECRQRKRVIKDGEVIDRFLYVRLRDTV
jgi:RimJ/RimL family protein N-acetyltransferase